MRTSSPSGLAEMAAPAKTHFFEVFIYANQTAHCHSTAPVGKKMDDKTCYHRVCAEDSTEAEARALEDHGRSFNQTRFTEYQCKKDSFDNKRRYATARVEAERQKKGQAQQKRKAPAQKPKVPAQKPKVPAQNPKVPAQKPKVPAQKPKVPAQKPKAPAQKPKAPAKKTKAPAQKRKASAPRSKKESTVSAKRKRDLEATIDQRVTAILKKKKTKRA